MMQGCRGCSAALLLCCSALQTDKTLTQERAVDQLDSEAGFGTAACNDNTDNDGDLAVDAADPECSSGADEDEAG